MESRHISFIFLKVLYYIYCTAFNFVTVVKDVTPLSHSLGGGGLSLCGKRNVSLTDKANSISWAYR